MNEEHQEMQRPEEIKEPPEVLGEITIAPDIIATLAAITTMKVTGVTGMAGVPAASLSALIGKRELNKGVKVEVKDRTVHLEIAIVADIDSVLIDVARRIQREVKNVVETKTGMSVTKVDVNIRDVSYREEPKEETPSA